MSFPSCSTAVGIALHVEHDGHRRTVNIGIDQSYAITGLTQGNGQVGRDGGFSHSAFARSDGDDVAHPGDGSLDRGDGIVLRLFTAHRSAYFGFGIQFFHQVLDLVFHLAAHVECRGKYDGLDVYPTAVHLDVPHPAHGYQVLRSTGHVDRAQGLDDFFLVKIHCLFNFVVSSSFDRSFLALCGTEAVRNRRPTPGDGTPGPLLSNRKPVPDTAQRRPRG